MTPSFIHILGLAVGMAVTMLIGFWIYDEVSFDRTVNGIVRIVANTPSNGPFCYATVTGALLTFVSIIK